MDATTIRRSEARDAKTKDFLTEYLLYVKGVLRTSGDLDTPAPVRSTKVLWRVARHGAERHKQTNKEWSEHVTPGGQAKRSSLFAWKVSTVTTLFRSAMDSPARSDTTSFPGKGRVESVFPVLRTTEKTAMERSYGAFIA
jgi:hypothetical protein